MKQKKSKDRIEKDTYFSSKKVQELENKLKNAEDIIQGLKNEKQRIERIISISPSIITVYNCIEQKNTFQNKSLLKLLGYSKKEIEKYATGKLAIKNSLIHPEDIKKNDGSFYDFDKMKDGETYLFEFRIKDSKGKWQWIKKSSSVLKRDGKNKPIEIISSNDIITNLKEKEKEIENKKDEYKSLTENLPDLIARFDNNLRYLYISPNIKNITGIPSEKFLGKTYWEVKMPKHLCEHWDEGIKKVFKTGKINPIEYSYKNKTGEIFFETRLIPEKDSKGNTKSVLAINRIITELKKASETTKESEEKFRSIFENAHDVIVIVDKFGKVLEINSKIESLIGIEREKVIGKNIFRLKVFKTKKLFNMIKNFTHTVKTGSLIDKNAGEDFALSELELTTAKGETIFISASSSALRKNGKITGFLSILRDITQRKKADEEIKLTQELLEKIAVTSPSIITVFDLEKQNKIFENKSLLKTLGYPIDEINKINLLPENEALKIFMHPDDIDKYMNLYRFAKKWDDTYIHEMELRIKDYWGNWKWFRRISKVFSRNAKNKPNQVISIFDNINDKKLAEENIIASEEFNRAISQHAPIGISVRSADGRLLSYNNAWKKIWAISEKSIYEDMTMKREKLFFNERDIYLDRWQKKVKKIYEEGGSLFIPELKTRITKKDKAEWVSNYFYAIKNPEGKVDRVVILTEDITERKKAELELVKTKQLLEKITAATPAIIAVSDVNKGTNLYQNRSLLEMLGYSRDDVLKLTKDTQTLIKIVIHPDDIKSLKDFDNNIDTLEDNTSYTTEYRIKDKDNNWQWIKRVCRVFQRDENGTPSHMVSIFENVNESKKAEEALRESERTAQALLNTITETVIMQDSEGKILSLNDTAAQRFGKTKEELIGNYIQKLFPDDVKELRITKLNEVIEKKEPVRFADERNKRFYDTTMYPVTDAEKYVNKVIIFARDITEQMLYERVIKESEERYRNLIETSPDGIIIHSDGRILFANKSAAKILGYKDSGEFFNKNVFDFIHPDFNEKVTERIHKIIQKNESVPFIEEKYIKQDGSFIDVEVSALPYHFKGKTAIQIIVRDISYRKEAEKALKQSEERYRTFIERSTEGIYRVGFEKPIDINVPAVEQVKQIYKYGYFAECNDTMAKMYGLKKTSELVGRKFYELITDRGKPEENTELINFVNSGYKMQNRETREKVNGKIRYFVYNSVGIVENGFLLNIWGTQSDTTVLKERESEVLKLSRAINQSPVSIMITDTTGSIEYVNPKFTDVTGYSADEVKGKNPSILKSGNKTTEEYKELWKTIKSGNEWRGEFLNKKKNGELFWESSLITPVKNQKGETIHYLGIKQDITQQRIIDEKLKQSLKEKEVMLREIHHRVKNNLQIISSLLKLQSGYTEDPIASEYLKISQHRVKTMALIHQQLYRSQDLSGINFKEYLNRLAKNLFDAYGINNRNIKLDIYGGDILLSIDNAIPCGLIVNELVSNSLKHAFKKGFNGNIEIEIIKNDNEYIMTVSDNGTGIPDNIDYRNTQSLGMQLVMTLVEQIAGSIKLDKKTGSKFIIAFPVNA